VSAGSPSRPELGKHSHLGLESVLNATSPAWAMVYSANPPPRGWAKSRADVVVGYPFQCFLSCHYSLLRGPVSSVSRGSPSGGRCPHAIAPLPWSGGSSHCRWIASTDNRGSPIISGQWQPSCNGTSRMKREVHVRTCQWLAADLVWTDPGSAERCLTASCRRGIPWIERPHPACYAAYDARLDAERSARGEKPRRM
jgi:hypothetical protein